MTRLLAMAGYVYQSAAAIILIFAISHLLPPPTTPTFRWRWPRANCSAS